jgi:hypothetical protein
LRIISVSLQPGEGLIVGNGLRQILKKPANNLPATDEQVSMIAV